MGGALGAELTQRIQLKLARMLIGWLALITGLFLVISGDLLSLLMTGIGGQASAVQLAAAFGILVPVGFACDITLPFLIRFVRTTGKGLTVPILSGTYEMCLVLGSSLAMALVLQTSLVWCASIAATLFSVLFLLVGLWVISFDQNEIAPLTAQVPDGDFPFTRPNGHVMNG